MAHRSYVDSDGRAWDVWEVIPRSVERRTLRQRRVAPRDAMDRRQRHEVRLHSSNGFADGWLVFEASGEKKRLRPIPLEWQRASATELESMCARAERASRPSQRLVE